MAKLKSLFKFEGSIDDVTVYQSKDGLIVRRKGGLSRERINSDPKLQRIRENNTEFGEMATSTRFLKQVFSALQSSVRTGNLTRRLSTILANVKNMDTTSNRGQRKVGNGIENADAKALLKGFNFGDQTRLENTLTKAFTVNATNGQIDILGLIPRNDLSISSEATKVAFKAYWAKVDFITQTQSLAESNTVMLPIDMTASKVNLVPVAPPTGDGVNIFVLAVGFYQTINGADYPLQSGAAAIVEIV